METSPVGPIRDTAQRKSHIPEQIRLPIEIANCQFPLAGQLHFIHGIGRLFNGDPFAIPQPTSQFRLLRFEQCFLFV
jgi:hypothetical protein